MDFITNAECCTAVARSRLHIHATEWCVEQNLSVHYGVVSDPTGESKISQTRLLMEVVQDVKTNFFKSQLQTSRDVSLAFGQRSAAFTGGTKSLHKLVRKDSANNWRTLVPGHVHAFRMMTKVIEVQTKLPAFFGAKDVAKFFDVARLAVGRQAHHLAFIAIMGKTDELRRRRIHDSG